MSGKRSHENNSVSDSCSRTGKRTHSNEALHRDEGHIRDRSRSQLVPHLFPDSMLACSLPYKSQLSPWKAISPSLSPFHYMQYGAQTNTKKCAAWCIQVSSAATTLWFHQLLCCIFVTLPNFSYQFADSFHALVDGPRTRRE